MKEKENILKWSISIMINFDSRLRQCQWMISKIINFKVIHQR